MIMKHKGDEYYKVFGGKYHSGFRPEANIVKDKEFCVLFAIVNALLQKKNIMKKNVGDVLEKPLE